MSRDLRENDLTRALARECCQLYDRLEDLQNAYDARDAEVGRLMRLVNTKDEEIKIAVEAETQRLQRALNDADMEIKIAAEFDMPAEKLDAIHNGGDALKPPLELRAQVIEAVVLADRISVHRIDQVLCYLKRGHPMMEVLFMQLMMAKSPESGNSIFTWGGLIQWSKEHADFLKLITGSRP